MSTLLDRMIKQAKILPGLVNLAPGEMSKTLFDTGESAGVQFDEILELASYARQDWAKRNDGLRRAHSIMASDQLFIEPLQPIMMADGTTLTGTAEGSLWPIQFSSLAINFLHKAQQHLEFCAWGVATTPASGATTATVTPRWGTTTGGAALGASAASATVTVSKTNVPWYMTGNLMMRSLLAGANSVIVAGGDFVCDQIAIPGICFGGTVVSTIDVTAAGGIWPGLTLGGSASFTMTTRGLIIKNVS